MKTSSSRHWYNSLPSVKQTGPASRARRRRQPLALEVLEGRVTPSLTPQMVLDINTNTLSSNPSAMVAVGSTTYFTADDGVHGIELWKSDAAGTVLVKDILPGSGSSKPGSLTNVNGTLFISADDGTHGPELWKSDGTAAGTVLVQDIFPAGYAIGPSNLVGVNGTVFFSAYDGATGWELWKSDGSATGTVLVKDINPGSSGSGPGLLTNLNGTLFFSAQDATHGYALWKSDGTAAGTTLVKDIFPGIGNNYSGPFNLTNVNGTLFFTADDGTHGRELWESDGTAAGTTLVKDIRSGSSSSIGYSNSLTNVNGTLFFTADDGTNGLELWKSDGTAAGTVLVKDIYDIGNGSQPAWLTNVNGTLFFAASDPTGRGLWKSDGTAAGTTLVYSTSPANLTNVNGTLFFIADDGTNGLELWKSDGTAAGTVLVKDIYPGSTSNYTSSAFSPTSLTNVNGTLMFAANDGRHGVELWMSDGTATGTTLVKDINTSTSGSSYGWDAKLTDVSGTLFFTADDGVHGRELWKSDGTASGSTLVKDLFPGGHTGYYYGGYYPNSSSPGQLTNVNGTLFFTAYGGLWKSDGTEAGTSLVARVNANNLTNVNGTLFFWDGDPHWGYDGVELWKSDGTTSGTVMVKDIFPGQYRGAYIYPNSSFPSNLTSVSGTLFFTANDWSGRELWKSDGTASGTVLVKDIRPGSAWSYPSWLTNVNGTLFFAANNDTTGRGLWKSDGTAAGTTLVYSTSSANLTNVNGTLFFQSGSQLWKSDGTAAGTVMLKDIRPGGPGTYFQNLTDVNGTLFFTADDGTHGWELWKSDGTPAGTTLFKDINLAGSSSPSDLTNINGTLFFTAGDGAWKLWQSDGTADGTVPVANLASDSLTNVNGTLFFSANDWVHGWELWKLVDDGTQGTTLDVGGFPVTITAGVAGSFMVAAKNIDGTTNTGYRGTVHFTSSDSQAVLPADYTFTVADGGVHTFSATLKTAGGQSIAASDTIVPGVAGTQAGITVNPAAASRFTVAGFPSPATAGVAGSFTVTAQDAYGNRASGYAGTVRFTSSDTRAILPGTYTFTAADAGTHAFSATLKTAGTQSLSVTDTANAAVAGTQSVTVNPAAASRLLLSAPASVRAGASFSLTVTVVDAYGNVVTGYRGTLAFRSSDSTARLPRNYAFTSADGGAHTFTGLVLKRKGTQTITVTDTQGGSLTASATIQVL
jgi:ELWxxDGT repeat protein